MSSKSSLKRPRDSSDRADQGSAPNREPESKAILVGMFETALYHHQRNDYASAEIAYRQILAIDQDLAIPLTNLAAILHETGRCDEAIEACRKALSIKPLHQNAMLNLASALQKRGDFAGAAETYEEILAHHSQSPVVQANLAYNLERSGQLEKAAAAYDDLIVADPANTILLTARADVLNRMDRKEEAMADFAEVIRLDPDNAVALSSLGIMKALNSIDNNLDVAITLCLKAALLRPDFGPILNNLAIVAQLRGETDNALSVLRELVKLHPDFAPAYSNIGSILSILCRYDQAEDALATALRLDPGAKEAKIELAKVRRHLCDWTHDSDDAETLRGLLGQGINYLIVFMAVSSSGEEQLAYACAAMAKYNARATRRPWAGTAERRLKIGYLSGDFRDHPVGRLMPDVIRLHDRERFDVFGYALGTGPSTALFGRYAQAFDTFVDLARVTDSDASRRIANDGIDILIDLTGPTANSRFDILAERPAPVQVSFLGLPGTTGSDALDYVVGDHFLMPPGSERFYHEALVRLPHCYQPSDRARPVPDRPASRAMYGLPETGFVFCSFNSPVKITPEVFDVWMRLLQSVEGSILWLYCKAERARVNLVERAAERGVAAQRIVFAPPVPVEAYLARLTCADLFLDTFPYAAGATCNDALWVGLPVLTCVGETYASRMAGSLLATLGLPELVTTSLASYEDMARRIASQPALLRDIRDRIEAGRAESPLFAIDLFTKSLETAYVQMANTASAGALPTDINL